MGSDSSKTIIDQAKREVPGFTEHFKKFEQEMVIGGYSSSTLFCYGRAMAKISLYWKKSLLDLSPSEVNDFLYALVEEKKATDLNKVKAYFGLERWKKQTIKWEDIVRKKLNVIPNKCPKCKKLSLEIVEIIQPIRGPPNPKTLKPNCDF